MKTSARSLSLFAGAVALAALVTGCATATSPSAGQAPSSSKISADAAPRAAWLDASSFVIATRSDDGCAPTITDIVAGDQRIDVTLAPGAGEECAAEAASAHGTYLGVPAGLDSSRPMTIAVTEHGGEASLIELPGLAGGEIAPADRMPPQLPAAAWIGDDELAVLTWGSSTCVPTAGVVDGDAIVLDEPLDGVCTMDLVPRITFVPAEGVAADAELTLSGYTDEAGEPVVLTPVPRA
ncbi:hypothetical protein [Streptomyces sp. AC495_CC817]|uniref:hypothetical protein n=1 Tax=Streptomyces sp. AC495_CC817 TaxID=2823900 RepID=UPI001C273361|nr:hypothetical protein [Streptomyces sp. AC495_CC817]